MGRLPQRPVTAWNRKQAQHYAYCAMERDMLSDETEVEQAGSAAFGRLATMPRAELNTWALRELEYRQMTRGKGGPMKPKPTRCPKCKHKWAHCMCNAPK